MTYEYWIFQQEEPDLCEPRSTGFRKQHTPTWIEKLKWEKEFREKVGEERYQQFLKQDQERAKRYEDL